MYPIFELSKGKNNKYFWKLISRNGRVILRSCKGYKTKQNAQKSIANVITYGQVITHYEIETANVAGNGFYYRLYGRKSGNLIAISGNGKSYKSVNWQIATIGVNRGVTSCVNNLEIIAQKRLKGQKYIADYVTDNRATK